MLLLLSRVMEFPSTRRPAPIVDLPVSWSQVARKTCTARPGYTVVITETGVSSVEVVHRPLANHRSLAVEP